MTCTVRSGIGAARKCWGVGALACASVLVAACTPSRELVYASEPFAAHALQVSEIAVITDAALAIGEADRPLYYSIADSLRLAAQMNAQAVAQLEGKRYRVRLAASPAVGAWMTAGRAYRFARERSGEISDAYPPLLVADAASFGWSEGADYVQLAREVRAIMIAVSTESSAVPPLGARAREALAQLARRSEADAALFVFASGVDLSFARQMRQLAGEATLDLLAAVVVAGITGDPGTPGSARAGRGSGGHDPPMPAQSSGSGEAPSESFVRTRAALIDLSSGQLLWANAHRLAAPNVASRIYYPKWASDLLHHLPTRD